MKRIILALALLSCACNDDDKQWIRAHCRPIAEEDQINGFFYTTLQCDNGVTITRRGRMTEWVPDSAEKPDDN